MSKKFKKITLVSSNEVSLCSKYNSGANKQTEFEIVKDQEGEHSIDIKPVLQEMVKYCDECVEEEHPKVGVEAFKDFLNYWLEYDLNNCFYNLLSEAVRSGITSLQYNEDLTKEEKTVKFAELFNQFLQEYMTLPITKTEDGKYNVSLVHQSHIQDKCTHPQSETEIITKENTSKMETEQKSVIQKAIELLSTAFGLEKTETPAEEPAVETPVEPTVEPTVEPVAEPTAEPIAEKPVEEEAKEPAEEPKAEVEAPIVEKAEETVEPTKDEPAEVVEKTEDEPVVEPETVEKTSENTELQEVIKQKLDLEKELQELKKVQEEKEVEIAKMSFVQKAKDEYSMLAGTPEEIGAKLYNISKSNLDEEAKSFIMEQLKKVAKSNEELTEEVGSMNKSADDMTEEDLAYAKAEEIAKAKNISVNKALRQIK